VGVASQPGLGIAISGRNNIIPTLPQSPEDVLGLVAYAKKANAQNEIPSRLFCYSS
jgi:hypothetical protein